MEMLNRKIIIGSMYVPSSAFNASYVGFASYCASVKMATAWFVLLLAAATQVYLCFSRVAVRSHVRGRAGLKTEEVCSW